MAGALRTPGVVVAGTPALRTPGVVVAGTPALRTPAPQAQPTRRRNRSSGTRPAR